MRTVTPTPAGAWWQDRLRERQVRVALVTGACSVLEAVVAKNVLDADLSWFAQLVPLWIFIVYLVSDARGRVGEIAFTAAIVLATAAVLVLYGV